jgi:hypothetical protein
MTNQDENRNRQTESSAEPDAKKPYQSPELTVHGKVDEITQFLLAVSPH